MDSQTGFDEHEDFFESYDAEQARSLAPLELDVENEVPSAEQLARATRFRKPVALFVSAMALFSAASLISFRMHRAQPELVARYNAALPAAAANARNPAADVAPAEPSGEAASAVVPELTVNASEPEPEDSAPDSASDVPAAAANAPSVRPVSIAVAASASLAKRSGGAPTASRVADARGLPARLTSSAQSAVASAPASAVPATKPVVAASAIPAPTPVVAASAVPASKSVVGAPSSFNSVARFPDARH